MKRTVVTIALTGALAALATPALAADTPTAEQQCRAERSEMGVQTFRQTYGTNKSRKNAFGKCVSKRNKATHEAEKAARQECKAEKKKPHGDCVGEKAAETVAAEVEADVNAAKTCKTERKADPDAFKEKYGTNKNRRNAFGKCVSKTAKDTEEASA